MDILYLLVPLGLGVALAIGFFFWIAVRSGQFDDLDSPGRSVLDEDEAPVADPPGSGKFR